MRVADFLDLVHMLLVYIIKFLVVLHDAILQRVKLLIQQFSIASLRILGVSENDTTVWRKVLGAQCRKKHVGFIVHFGLKFVADLLLKTSYFFIGARDLSNVEVGHDHEHEERWDHPHDPNQGHIDLKEHVVAFAFFPNLIDFVSWHGQFAQSSPVNLQKHQLIFV